ncbi:MAG: hypothetical protein WBO24_01480 [Nitrospirales bacterium]
MGNHRRKQYAADFKRGAVALVIHHGCSVAEAAKNKGHQTPEQAELHRLHEENRQLRMERDILKKAMTFFASEPR